MSQSPGHILTTHTGSLPRPVDLAELMTRYSNGQDRALPGLWERVASATREVVERQLAIGIDVPSDGEFGKAAYAGYVKERLTGFDGPLQGAQDAAAEIPGQADPAPAAVGRRNSNLLSEQAEFPDFVRSTVLHIRYPLNTGPVSVGDGSGVARDVATFKTALHGATYADAFMPAASPGVIAGFMPSTYYPRAEDYLWALADAMKSEYHAIVDAGFVLQVDCPDLVKITDPQGTPLSLAEIREVARAHVAVLNYALQGLPSERLRLHLCWGNYEGPHNHDLPLEAIVDIALEAHVGGLCIEAANPRHAHEWRVFERVELPDGMTLIPGVIDSCTNYIEHPDLVAQRLVRFAEVVGRDHVMAGTDCGFGTSLGIRHVAASVAWAKLESLVEGARRASLQLWQ